MFDSGRLADVPRYFVDLTEMKSHSRRGHLIGIVNCSFMQASFNSLSESIVRSSSSSIAVNEPAPMFTAQRAPSYQSSKRLRYPSNDSMEKVRPKGSVNDVGKRSKKAPNRGTSSELDSDPDANLEGIGMEPAHSMTAYRVRPLKQRSRNTRSEPDIYRKSGRRPPSRKKVPVIEEYDSPPSDYYLQEDAHRRSMRMNSTARTVY